MRILGFFALILLVAFASHEGVEGRHMAYKCSKGDIVISQAPIAPQPNGIPTYLVEITNTCVNRCAISNIHLHCGVFSSANLILPRVFRRLAVDDCLVNDGGPLAAYLSLSFKYTTIFMFPLSVSSFTCQPPVP